MKSCCCPVKIEKGSKGNEGPVGSRGPLGYPGIMGVRGLKGEPGCMGNKGEPGIIGLKGQKGSAGLDGNSGIKGVAGEAGIGITDIQSMDNTLEITYGANDYTVTVGNVKGCDGKQGIPGNAAAKGDLGPRGLTGLKGDDGSSAYVIPNLNYLSLERSPSLFYKNYFEKYDFFSSISTSWSNMTNRNLQFKTTMAINKDYIKNFYLDLDIEDKKKIIKLLLVSYQTNYKKFVYHSPGVMYCNTYLNSMLVTDPATGMYKLKMGGAYTLGNRTSNLNFIISDYLNNFETFDFEAYFNSASLVDNIIEDTLIVPYNHYFTNLPTYVPTTPPTPSTNIDDYVKQNNNIIAMSNTFLVNIRHIPTHSMGPNSITDDKLEFLQNFTGKHRKLERGMLILEIVNPNDNYKVKDVAGDFGISSLSLDKNQAPFYILIVNYFNYQTGYFTTLDIDLQTPKIYENYSFIGCITKGFKIKGYFDFVNEKIRMSMFFNPIVDIGISPIYCGNLPDDQEDGFDYLKDYITGSNVPLACYYNNNNVLFEFIDNLTETTICSNYLKAISGLYDVDTWSPNLYHLTGMNSNN